MLNKLKIWLHERKEKRLYLEWLRATENNHYKRMTKEASEMQKRPSSTIANAPKVQINAVKKAA